MKFLPVSITIAASIVLLNCNNIFDSSDRDHNHLQGIVLHHDGTPAAGIGINLVYYFQDGDSVIQYDNLGINHGTQFGYSLHNQSHVTIHIEREFSGQNIRTLVDSVQMAGMHSTHWDGKNDEGMLVYNGLYAIIMSTDNSLVTNELIVLYNYEGYRIEEVELLAVTDKRGYFDVSQESMPFHYTGIQTNDEGIEIGEYSISRNVSIWAIMDSITYHYPHMVSIDSNSGAFVTIELD